MSNELTQKNAELGKFLFCERYTLQPVKNALYIAEGQDLKRGAVVDVNGVLVGTNSLMPYAVLETDCDTRAKGAFASVFVKGEFNFDKLFFADGLSKEDLDNIVYNGSGTGLVFKPYDYDTDFSPVMVPTGTSEENPIMNAEDVERMINAMKPIDAMTLRFEFSKKDYNPDAAGVGSDGTWTKVASPTLNVWDWTNENTDWHESFKGAFPYEDNEVSVIAAGDTSSVTSIASMFAGVYTSNPGSTGYSLTTRNNIVFCIPFDVSNVTGAENMFHGTTLKEIVKFAFNGCSVNQMFSNSYIHDFDEIELCVSSAFGLFSLCFNLVNVGKIKFDPAKLVQTSTGQPVSLFSSRSSYGQMNIETIEGIEGTGIVTNFTNFLFNMQKLKRIGGEIDCTSAKDCTAMFQNCKKLEHLPVLKNLGSSQITSTYLMFNNCFSLKEFPVFDTSHVTNAKSMFASCINLTEIPNYNFSSVTNVDSFCFNSINVKRGILETYNKFLNRGASITSHTKTFSNCGIDTAEGRAELAQIPKSWGGLAEG